MRFFSDRGVYTGDAHQMNRLNERYNHIILPNLAAVVGKKILDLGSHDGRWIWALLESGAIHVTGVEGRKQTTERMIPQLAGRRQQFRVIIGDVFDALSAFRPYQFDTIMCLGLFYHILNHDRLIELMAKLRPRAVIIDTGLIDTDSMVIELKYEDASDPLMGLAPVDIGQSEEKVLVGMPSRGALNGIAGAYGFDTTYIEWSGADIESEYQIGDYLRRERFTVVLRQAGKDGT